MYARRTGHTRVDATQQSAGPASFTVRMYMRLGGSLKSTYSTSSTPMRAIGHTRVLHSECLYCTPSTPSMRATYGFTFTRTHTRGRERDPA
eukprot:1484170-Prymnesium_polylepis.1